MPKDTPFVRILSQLGDLLVLNLLCLFCAVPIVTAGASVSALYAVLFRQKREDQVSLVKDFFRAFRRNFWQATALEAVIVLTAIFGLSDLWYGMAVGGGAGKLFLTLGTVVTFLALSLQILAISQQAVYSNTIGNYLRNSFILAFCAPGRLLVCLAAWIIPWVLLAAIPEFFLEKLGAAYLMWGFSAPAWATVQMLDGLFKKTETK